MKKRTKAGYERRSRGICEEDQQLIRKMIQENQQPAVILSSANYDPLSRRKRIAWTPGEVMYVPPFGGGCAFVVVLLLFSGPIGVGVCKWVWIDLDWPGPKSSSVPITSFILIARVSI